MHVPKDWVAGESKTGKINEILAFLRIQFPDEAGEKVAAWSQSAPVVDQPKSWRWYTDLNGKVSTTMLLDRTGKTVMAENLTDEQKAEVVDDLGTLEPHAQTVPEGQEAA